jgi:outer membrane protein assembly factor BamB
MYKSTMRARMATVAVAALSMLGATEAGAAATTGVPHSARASAAGAKHAAAVPGDKLWVRRYHGPGGSEASAVAVGPRGGRVFVTGSSYGTASGTDFATVAYDAGTGAQLWVKRYNGPGNGTDTATAIAVSPTGGTVFVTGTSAGPTSGTDYATVAYNATTGAQLWVNRYNGPGNGTDTTASMAVSRTGNAVFVTGTSAGPTSAEDYATVAYNATTGAQLWVNRYNGPGNGTDTATAIGVSTGGTVFVTGYSQGITAPGFATIAYNATTGAQSWARRYNGRDWGGDHYAYARSLAISPTGNAVFVTGESAGDGTNDYTTVAYNAVTGAQQWVRHYDSGYECDEGRAVAVSPSGAAVLVTGSSSILGCDAYNIVTVAYSASTGARLWTTRWRTGQSWDIPYALKFSPDGDTAYVTGTRGNDGYATLAYSTTTGAQLWVKLYGTGVAYGMAVSPTSGTVFVTGGDGSNYLTIAYAG